MRVARWCLGAALILMLLVPAASAQPARLHFDDANVLRIEAGGEAPVTVINDSSREMAVFVLPLDGDGTFAEAVSVTPLFQEISPGGLFTYRVSVNRSSGPFRGFLLTAGYAEGAGPLPTEWARRGLDVINPAPRPLVRRWTTASYRWKPGEALSNPLLPVEENSCGSRTSEATGTLAGPAGAAFVTARCEETPSPLADAVRLFVRTSGGRPGNYEGEVDLRPDDPTTGRLDMDVRRTDFFLVPTLVMLAAIGLALLVARQAARLAKLARLEEETWATQTAGIQAQRMFHEKARRTPWASYSLRPKLDESLHEIRQSLDDLRKSLSALDPSKGRFGEIAGRLEDLDRVVAAWPSFADRLSALDGSLDAVRTEAPSYRPESAEGEQPAFMERALNLLHGKPLNPQQALDRMEAVDETVRLADEWRAQGRTLTTLAVRARSIEGEIERHPDATSEDREMLDRAKQSITNGLETLWRVAEGRDLEEGELRALVAAASAALDELGRFAPPEEPRSWVGAAIARGMEAPPPPALEPLLAESDLPIREGGQRRKGGQVFGGRLVPLGLALVTLWTGLNLLYFDRPFGTVRDYVSILLWGFGVQAVLQLLAAVLLRALNRVVEPV
ncbi:MAG: hypothetical protein M3164_00630 [Actinomycetota bacterium]|nr:hypothetical protein [Actinomycetota bacterium]